MHFTAVHRFCSENITYKKVSLSYVMNNYLITLPYITILNANKVQAQQLVAQVKINSK